VRWSHSSTT